MSFIDKIGSVFGGGYDDEDMDYENDKELELEIEEEDEQMDYENRSRQLNNSSFAKTPSKKGNYLANMILEKPKSFEDAKRVSEYLLSDKIVVFNLNAIKDQPEKQRFIDFIAGSVYMIDGNFEEIETNVYVVNSPKININNNFNDR